MSFPFRVDITVLVVLPFLALLGAWFSKQLKAGRNGFFFLLPLNALLTGTTWAVVTKTTAMSLAVATVIFDTTYSLSYFLAFVLMGEQVTLIQGVGVMFALVALVLLSL
jgi:uncharacterized membrane protein